ncbi:two-component regulatory system sensor kinase [Burkholderia aenigmatica]|uniref:histidine kinase n=3 Tax=Burkholderia TaxID=32008 RepID=A0ABY6Y4X3_9BURK|nr:ATP-binding protein [Burkholderia aenigmatica]VWD36778.1 two-component regulatory system sensor kinase [Burkholderia aenigmatica]VWD65179.1 two-component regulatory system sensor kinase [Burkholderia aenigmatica]
MTVNAPSFKAGPAPRRIRPARYATLAALLTLALGMAASFAASRLLQNRAQEVARARFAQSATLATSDLRRSLLGAATVLRGARGFASTLAVPQSGDAWRGYLARLNLDGLQSPVRSVGRIEPSAADDNQAPRLALQRTAESGKVAVDRDIAPADAAFTSAGATTLFRLVQKALTNVARHADATHVTLALKVEDGYCMLRIADNGRGATESARDEHDRPSFGLIGIRERAHMLDGTVTIDNRPGTGFAITVALPLHAIQQGDVLS